MPKLVTFVVFLVGFAVIAGCAAKTSTASFYRLAPEHSDAATDRTQAPRLIALGPVRIPGYLDRPQIVTGSSGSRLELEEYHRWAEPLRDTVPLVLNENLAARLPGDHMVTFPWNRSLSPQYQIEVDIARFHVNAEGVAELWADWRILQPGRPAILKKTRLTQPVGGQGFDARVAAQNRVLALFSREIARILATLPSP